MFYSCLGAFPYLRSGVEVVVESGVSFGFISAQNKHIRSLFLVFEPALTELVRPKNKSFSSMNSSIRSRLPISVNLLLFSIYFLKSSTSLNRREPDNSIVINDQ